MADQEIVKHTKKVYKIWQSQEHSNWQKIKEFLIEIFIIVFAVTLSIWLHSWSEHKHEQKDVNHFLQDLKSDLAENNKLLENSKKELTFSGNGFKYFSTKKKHIDLHKDSIRKYLGVLEINLKLAIQKSQYEGYKYAAKLNRIENKKLAKDIIELYEKDIAFLEDDFNEYQKFKSQLQTKAMDLIDIDDNGDFDFNSVIDEHRLKVFFFH